MVLKEPICPYLNRVAFIFKFTWSNSLETNQGILQFYCLSAQGNDLTVWLGIH